MKYDLKAEMEESMDSLRFSQDDKNAMVHRLTTQPEENRPGNQGIRKLALVILAAVMILATLTGAAIYTRWTKSAERKYHATQQQKAQAESIGLSAMLETEAAQKDGLCATDQGITISASQAIVDKFSALIILRVDGFLLPEGQTPCLTISSAQIGDTHTVIPPGYFYDGITTSASGKAVYSDGSPAQHDPTGAIIPDYTAKDGSLEYYAAFQFSKGSNPVGKEITLQITAIGTESVPNLIQGDWELQWTLNGTAETRSSTLNTDIGNTGVTLLATDISPISLFAMYTINNSDGHIHNNDPEFSEGKSQAYKLVHDLFVGIRMKDGTIHHPQKTSGICSMYSDAGVQYDYPAYAKEILADQAVLITRSQSLDLLIDPNDVEALVFLKDYPAGKDLSEMTESDFCIVSLP